MPQPQVTCQWKLPVLARERLGPVVLSSSGLHVTLRLIRVLRGEGLHCISKNLGWGKKGSPESIQYEGIDPGVQDRLINSMAILDVRDLG